MSRGRLVLVAAAVGVLVGCALTFPLPLRLGSAVLEDGSFDAYQFLWNIWWARESLGHLRTNPFFTHYLFYPDGVPLLFHTLSFSLGLASWPLQALLPGGLVSAHNVLVVAAPALAVVFTALLAREVTDDPVAPLAAGLVAALNPVAVWFLPVLYLSCSWLIAALLWAWWRLHRRRRAGDVALALGVLAALVFASQEYALIGLALLAFDSVARLLAARRLGVPPAWRGGLAAFWGAALAGLGGLALLALSAPAEPPPLLHLLVGSGYVAGMITPPWLVRPPLPFWTVIFLGTVPLALAPVALALGRRPAWYWAGACALGALMALGPYMHLQHPFPDAKLPPGGPRITGVPGPYLLALELVPLLGFFRAAYRWVVGAELALAVLTALAVAGLRARLAATPRRRALTLALFAVLMAGAFLDTRGLRAGMTDTALPGPYRILRDDPEPAALLELPSGLVRDSFAAFSSLYMYYQTAHRKFLLDGTLSRLPPGRRPLAGRALTDLGTLPYVKYVAVHHDLLARAHPSSREQAEQLTALARAQGELVARDDGLELYRLRTFRPESVR